MQLGATATKRYWGKLMALGALAFGVVFPIALANGNYVLAVSSFIALGVIALQWLTVDPPGVEDEDIHGRR